MSDIFDDDMIDDIDDAESTPVMPSEVAYSISRLHRDLRNAAMTMTPDEARFLVDGYYIIQETRKRSANQRRAMKKEPHEILTWLNVQSKILEDQIRHALETYSLSKPIGIWMNSIHGVAGVISAGMMAHIDINQAPTVGHIWRFAGLDPTSKWEKKTKRPWNAELKTLCWKVGQSFMKSRANEKSFYGPFYAKRKQYEIARNDAGTNAALAAELLPKFDPKKEPTKWLAGRYPLGTSAKLNATTVPGGSTQEILQVKVQFLKSVIQDADPKNAMLPPGQIDARARRYATKLFLAHMQNVWWWLEKGRLPPKPYVMEHLGHAHMIMPPNMPDDMAAAMAKQF